MEYYYITVYFSFPVVAIGDNLIPLVEEVLNFLIASALVHQGDHELLQSVADVFEGHMEGIVLGDPSPKVYRKCAM